MYIKVFLVMSGLNLIMCIRYIMSLIPGLGRSPGEGHGKLLQYSCLENPTATVHRVAKESGMT